MIAYFAFLHLSGIDLVLRPREVINPLSWYSQIIFWIWRYDSHLVQSAKRQQYVQGDLVITILDIYLFPNIATTTIVYVHSCELTKCELFLAFEILLP